ncbi:polysaccharide deacetylase family protein [Bordetella genomosp. 13]|uniref:polysaccharide deacetylase family protein n=1 Tax=Bordetella genomosp. 13 TaxID=463040 RepID=UPI0011A5D78C|nr:polysaccharide deacetylase family protein [Bordetella genomosp. 13]
MDMTRALIRRGGRWLARHSHHAWLAIPDGPPVVSITFDDVNASACDTGAAILQRHGCLGTFYVAGGLTDGSEQSRATHSVAQLRTLRQGGHQLGCHGWSHRHATRLPLAQWQAELKRNHDFLREITGDDEPLDFAYPFGDYGYGVKQACAAVRRSSRITGGGMHHGRADLNLLGSYRLYGEDMAAARWRAFLDGARRGSWAILNTHGVEADCGHYGSTPEALEGVIRYAQDKGCTVLPVGQAIAHLRARQA